MTNNPDEFNAAVKRVLRIFNGDADAAFLATINQHPSTKPIWIPHNNLRIPNAEKLLLTLQKAKSELHNEFLPDDEFADEEY